MLMFDFNTSLGVFLWAIGVPLLIGMAATGILGEVRLWVIDWLTYNKIVKLEKDLDYANEIIENLQQLASQNKGNNANLQKELTEIKAELAHIKKMIDQMKEEDNNY